MAAGVVTGTRDPVSSEPPGEGDKDEAAQGAVNNLCDVGHPCAAMHAGSQ